MYSPPELQGQDGQQMLPQEGYQPSEQQSYGAGMGGPGMSSSLGGAVGGDSGMPLMGGPQDGGMMHPQAGLQQPPTDPRLQPQNLSQQPMGGPEGPSLDGGMMPMTAGLQQLPTDPRLQGSMGQGMQDFPGSGMAEQSMPQQRHQLQPSQHDGYGGESYASGGPAGGRQHSNVYVRNIPEDVSEPQLEALFRVYGDVNSCRLVRGNRSNPRGYGFVRFSSVNEAILAINSLNGYQTGGATLEVKFADSDAGPPKGPAASANSMIPKDNLYVRNLPSHWMEADVINFFQPFGDIVELRLLNPTESGRSLAALVRMNSVSQATAAVESLNGRMTPGGTAPVLLRYADSAEDKAKRSHRSHHQHLKTSRYSPYQGGGGMVSSGLGPGGGSGDMAQGSGGNWPSGAFAGFNAGGMQEMNDMVSQGMNGGIGNQLDSGEYDSHVGIVGNTASGMIGAGMHGVVDPSGFLGSKTQTTPTSVFIKNLPPDSDKLYLYEKFAPYGAITSVKVLIDENSGQCTGIGFVNYSHHDSAVDAINAMHGLKVADKQLIVTIQTHRKHGGPGGGTGMYHAGSSYH